MSSELSSEELEVWATFTCVTPMEDCRWADVGGEDLGWNYSVNPVDMHSWNGVWASMCVWGGVI
jgi:hypothetical protein